MKNPHHKPLLLTLATLALTTSPLSATPKHTIGQPIDHLNGVAVYYNGDISHVSGRNLAEDGYNIGQQYQCVEFVKRYYYQHLKHKMPDSYGHAKDFFDPELEDGQQSERRNLTQYRNPSAAKPQPDDLLVFSGHAHNPYGHVAIVAAVSDTHIELIQQNPGPSAPSRIKIALLKDGEKWKINDSLLLGWLRKEPTHHAPAP